MNWKMALSAGVFLIPCVSSICFAATYTTSYMPATGAWRNVAYAINNSGVVAGWNYGGAQVSEHAALWVHNAEIVLPSVPPAPVSAPGDQLYNPGYAYGINDTAQVAGTSIDLNGIYHATVWSNGSGTYLGPVGGTNSQAYGINNAGVVVGSCDTAGNSTYHAALWAHGLGVDLGTLGGAASKAAAINNVGAVVGQSQTTSGATHATLWKNDGTLVDLGTLGGNNSWAYDINDSGQIVGASELADGATHATLWTNGQIIDLGTLSGANDNSVANSINNLGQIVGTSDFFPYGPGLNKTQATLWDHGSIINLNVLDYDGSTAEGINDLGEIVGYSRNMDDDEHAFMLTPDSATVPEPSTLISLGAGLVGIILSAARKKKAHPQT